MKHAYGYLRVYQGNFGGQSSGGNMGSPSPPLVAQLSSPTNATAAFTDTPGCSMAVIGNLTVNFTTLLNEYVDFAFNGAVIVGTGLIYGYQVDSNTPVPCGYLNLAGNETAPIATVRAGPFSAGSHSISVVASTAGGVASTFGASNFQICVLEVFRYVG